MSDVLGPNGDLLDLLYAAPGQPDVWQEFVRQVTFLMDAPLGAFLFIDPSLQASSVQANVGWPEDVLRQYEEYYGSIDAWYLAYKKHQISGWTGVGSSLCPPHELEKTEFYNDFLRPADVYHECGIILEEGGGRLTVLTVNRSKHQMDFGSGQVRFLTSLVPHLKRALHLHKKMLGWQHMASAAAYVVDTLDVGLVGIGMDGNVCFMNRVAQVLLRTRKVFRVHQGRILVHSSLDQATLDRLLRTAGHLDLEVPVGGVISLSDDAGSVHLSVLPCRNGAAYVPARLKVLITITDPSSRPSSRAQVLCELFRLTPAEARISMLLASGIELNAIAESTRTTPNTVRSHLKSIYQKTNVSKQSQLVRLISLLPGQPAVSPDADTNPATNQAGF